MQSICEIWDKIHFSSRSTLDQLTNGSAHLTYCLTCELNGLSHWLTGQGRWSMDITPCLRTIEENVSWCNIACELLL